MSEDSQRRAYGPYEVESVLGKGAMGMVYLARDRRIGRKVALKTVQLEQKFDDESEANEFYKRLQREAELGGSLQHPNIVTLYEPGYENDVIAWLATEYIDGPSLREKLRKTKPLPIDEGLRIAEDVLNGLAHAHSKGIVHRDLKPANILLTSEGRAKLADFGIARPPNSTLTNAGSMLGTPSYMSPEQVRCSPVTIRSDLFGIGVVMYEMLTGVKPFAAQDLSAILRNVVELDPPPADEVNASIPRSVALFIQKLIAKRPENRFENAGAAFEEMKKIRAEILAAPSAEEAGLLTVNSAVDATVPAPPPAQHEITHASSTHVSSDDETPFILSPLVARETAPAFYRRRVPALTFWSIVASLAILLTTTLARINAEIDPRPTVMIARDQMMEFAAKRRALDDARGLAAAGKYTESIARYDDYLKRYPQSIAAQEARAEVVKAFEEAQPKRTVTVRPTRKKSETVVPTKPPEEEKKPSRWERFKRIFRGKSAAPA